ncbi:MAG TPA: MmcQ/YjbR family DNA-binding protein [Gammaproteobacteria bacterium]|nr:MmcQ/YjbR family DNA-binding protein [Gammaproteobacteria bacterium]
MNYKTIKNYLLSKPEAGEDYPFGPEVAVFRVKNRMFALLFMKNEVASVNLKCEPWKAAALRDVFDAVIPGYHMNKLHWNTVILNGSIPAVQIREMVDHSYAQVVKGLKKIEKNALVHAYGENEIYKAL